MATTNGTTTPSVSPGLGIAELKSAGIAAVGIGIAATVTVFAVQTAVVAGKALVANGKGLATTLKA